MTNEELSRLIQEVETHLDTVVTFTWQGRVRALISALKSQAERIKELEAEKERLRDLLDDLFSGAFRGCGWGGQVAEGTGERGKGISNYPFLESDLC